MASFFTGLFRAWAPSNVSVETSKHHPPPASSPSPPSTPLACVFGLLDQNGDGLLSVNEICQSFHLLGVNISPPHLTALLSSFPLSHPSLLQVHEFEAFYASICKDLSMNAHHIDQAAHYLSVHDRHDHIFRDLSMNDHHVDQAAHYLPVHDHPFEVVGGSPSCSHDVHGAHSCNDYDGTATATSCDDDDTHGANTCGDDTGSSMSSDDDNYHCHSASPHDSDGYVVHTCGNDAHAFDFDVIGNAPSSYNQNECSDGSDSGKGDAYIDDDDDDDDELLGAFRVFDKNADGFISIPELQTVLCNLGFSQCRDDSFCQGMLERVDSNGDGLVDFSEFKQMMLNSHFV